MCPRNTLLVQNNSLITTSYTPVSRCNTWISIRQDIKSCRAWPSAMQQHPDASRFLQKTTRPKESPYATTSSATASRRITLILSKGKTSRMAGRDHQLYAAASRRITVFPKTDKTWQDQKELPYVTAASRRITLLHLRKTSRIALGPPAMTTPKCVPLQVHTEVLQRFPCYIPTSLV